MLNLYLIILWMIKKSQISICVLKVIENSVTISITYTTYYILNRVTCNL